MLRKVTALFLCILTTVFLCSSCAGEGSSAYKAISVKEAKDMMDKGGVIVVDVRRADEYAESHIPGALNIANEDISTTPPAALPDKDASILVYCRTGVRSKEAAQKLAQMGYRNIYEFGGITDWQYATVSGSDAGSWTKDGEEEGEGGQGTQNGAASSTGIMGSFSAYDLQKNAVNQDILKDYDLTMVNVWATYCSPCISEMPELKELSEKYEKEGVQVVGLITDVLNSDGSFNDAQIETAKEIVSKTGADYTHILPTEDLYHILVQVSAVPTTFFVDKEGNLVGSAYAGARDLNTWSQIVDETLAELK